MIPMGMVHVIVMIDIVVYLQKLRRIFFVSVSCDNNDLVMGGPAGGGGGARVSVDRFLFFFCGDGKSV